MHRQLGVLQSGERSDLLISTSQALHGNLARFMMRRTVMHGRDKFRSRENRSRVRHIFLHDWDPIGIRGFPEAQDEYDAYADHAYVMLMYEGATADTIAAYLDWIASEHMGLGKSEKGAQACRKIGETLVALRAEFEAG